SGVESKNLTALSCRCDPCSASDRSGQKRSARHSRQRRRDGRRVAQSKTRSHLRGLSGRRPWFRSAGKPVRLLWSRGRVPRQTPRRPRRTVEEDRRCDRPTKVERSSFQAKACPSEVHTFAIENAC